MSEPARPPTPKGVPLLGNGLAFSRNPFEALEAWASDGDIVRLSFPRAVDVLDHRAGVDQAGPG